MTFNAEMEASEDAEMNFRKFILACVGWAIVWYVVFLIVIAIVRKA